MSKTAKTTEQKAQGRVVVAVNRRARHDYEIGETYVAGIALVGTEVKSVRAGRVNFQDAFCKVENGEMWLYNMHISPYEQGNRYNPDPKRKRKLLLHRYEIERLRAAAEQKGLTIIPLSLFFERGFAKLEIALARGKKLYDKRESIAERDREREMLRQRAGRE